MNYVISDLHGYDPLKLARLLKKGGVTESDTVFVLGDVIDRGEYAIELLSWVSGVDINRVFADYLLAKGIIEIGDDSEVKILKPQEHELIRMLVKNRNVKFLLGNHEHMMLQCRAFLGEITADACKNLDGGDLSALMRWMSNGYESTVDGLRRMQATGRADEIYKMVDFLMDAPLYYELRVGENDYILVHAGLGRFSPERPLDEYTTRELVWERPSIDTEYFEDKTVVFGHTPTFYLTDKKQYAGKVIKKGKSWIAIDTGAGSGYAPALVCLDKGDVIYGEKS